MSAIDQIDDKIYELATDKQRKYIDAVRKHKTYQKASEKLNVNPATIQKAVKATITKAAKQGYAPSHDLTHQTAPGNIIKRVSTNYDGDGNIRQQWVIQEAEKEKQLQLLHEAIKAICEEVKPLKASKLKSRKASKDLMVNIPIGDAHIGMLAWGEECGEDYDLDIAESLHKSAVDMLIDQTPAARACTIIDLGDFLHSDNLEGMTSRSGHALDMDSRYHKIIRVAIRISIYYINQALKKFEKVIYRPEVGNHNDVGAIWMQELLSTLYANEPRVTIGNNAGNVFYWQHGECFFMSHHGHSIKGERLPQLMSKHIMDNHIKTRHRKIYCGHVHHKTVTEHTVCEIQTYRTLAAKDAYAAGGGYSAERRITAETWHKKYGLISTTDVSLQMLEDKP